MSQAAKIPDIVRTLALLDLVHRKYAEGDKGRRRYAVIEEVAPSTGFRGPTRYADVLAMSLWPSDGLTLDGFELKASKADVKRELADRSKHHVVARYCDTWTLVAWDESILVDGIPEDWGILVSVEDEHGGRALKTIRRAPTRTPDPWPKGFVASLLRNAVEQSPAASFVARVVEQALDRARQQYRSQATTDARALVAPLARQLYGDNDWRWPEIARKPEDLVKLVAAQLLDAMAVRAAAGVDLPAAVIR